MRLSMTSVRLKRSRISTTSVPQVPPTADDAPPVEALSPLLGHRQSDGLERRQVVEQLIDLEGAHDTKPNPSCVDRSLMSSPSSRMRPLVGRCTPVNRLINVGLPALFGRSNRPGRPSQSATKHCWTRRCR